MDHPWETDLYGSGSTISKLKYLQVGSGSTRELTRGVPYHVLMHLETQVGFFSDDGGMGRQGLETRCLEP